MDVVDNKLQEILENPLNPSYKISDNFNYSSPQRLNVPLGPFILAKGSYMFYDNATRSTTKVVKKSDTQSYFCIAFCLSKIYSLSRISGLIPKLIINFC